MLEFFYDVIACNEAEGYSFHCESEVLQIKGGKSRLKIVEAEVKQALGFIKELYRETETLPDGLDLEEVKNVLERRKNNEIYCTLDETRKKLLLYGKSSGEVKKGKAELMKLLKEMALRNSPLHTKDNVDEKKLINIPYDYFMVMEKLHAEFVQNCVLYDHEHETATLDKRYKNQFETKLSEVRMLQHLVVDVPENIGDCGFLDNSDPLICVYNSNTSTVSVFGQDMKSVQDKVHQIRLELGLVEKSNKRVRRQLTDSFQLQESPDPGDRIVQRRDSASGGARPKTDTGQLPSTRGLKNCEIFCTKENIPVWVYIKNILYLEVDCIVNAANDSLKHGGGIAEVISKAAGRSLDIECSNFIKTNGILKTGEVFVSRVGNLNYKCVLHAVGPRWSDYKPHKTDDIIRCKRDLFMAVLNSFISAEQQGMKTIAVPAVSSGIVLLFLGLSQYVYNLLLYILVLL